MRYSGIQPQYFPRLHYFARILNADVFMIRDDAQFVRKHKYPGDRVDKSYQGDTPVKDASGRTFLSLPVQHLGPLPLTQTRLSTDRSWAADHLKAIQFAYGKSPYFPKLFPELTRLLNFEFRSLAELNIITILWGIAHILDLPISDNPALTTIANIEKFLREKSTFRLKRILRASEIIALSKPGLTANEKILLLCREVGATEDYCGGTGVSAYVDHSLFINAGIQITVQDWQCHTYPQQFLGKHSFIPNLSIIDLLMNLPPAGVVKIIKG